MNRPTVDRRVPSIGRMLLRGLVARCPACGRFAATRRWIPSLDACRRCGLVFERIEGHVIGSVGVNTIVSFAALVIALIIGMVATFPDFPVGRLVLGNVVVALTVPVLFLPSSRMLWTAIDIAMRPLEPHEVDWRAVYRSVGLPPPDLITDVPREDD